jgi:hypothetical protein
MSSYTISSWLLTANKASYVLGTKNARTFSDVADSFKLRTVNGKYTRESIERVIRENFGTLADAALARLEEVTC